LPWRDGAFDERALEQRYERASVMIGVLPVGKRFSSDRRQATFFWSLKTRDYAQWKAQGLARWREQVAGLWPDTEPLLKEINDPDEMVLAGYGHHTLPLPFGNCIVFVGDSAHSTSPQLGQGANMALLDVRALAEMLERMAGLEQALELYARKRRLHVLLYQFMSSLFTPFYQSDSLILPALGDWLVAPASRVPWWRASLPVSSREIWGGRGNLNLFESLGRLA
jgi:salicylate hydroxylase